MQIPNTEASTSIINPQKQRKTRSTGFPIISLEEAIEILNITKAAGFEMTNEVFAQEINMSPKGSSFHLKLAALRDFGLLEKRADKIVFTTLAKNILFDPTGDESNKKIKLQEALKNCKIFNEILIRLSSSGEFKTDTVGNIAVLEYGVAPHSRSTFIKSFIQSGKVADLVREVESGLMKIITSESPAENLNTHQNIDQTIPEDAQPLVANPQGEIVKTMVEKGIGWSINMTLVSANPLGKPVREAIEAMITALEDNQRK